MEAKLEIISTCQMRSFSYKMDTDMWPVWHFHPEFDILLILKNTGQYLNGDYIGDLKPGTLVMMGPNIPHAFHPTEADDNDPENPSTAVIQFSEISLGREFLQKPEMSHIAQFLADASRSFEFFGETRVQAEKIILDMKECSDLQRFIQLILLLDLMANSPQEDRTQLVSPLYSPSLNKDSVSKIDVVARYIMNNLSKRISLSDVAELSGMSSKSFSRFFKKNTGKSFVQYVNEMRIGQACRRLIETDDSISTICYDAGFNALSNFNRRFQEIKQMTPREFRLKYKEQTAK
ncbi:MAG: helix-turn-helix transcriptional regulator [Lentisphaeraceae bacterium]|nr:helix-turn-helix transcriptional regulator [Lentisphaeraceae bacterium]